MQAKEGEVTYSESHRRFYGDEIRDLVCPWEKLTLLTLFSAGQISTHSTHVWLSRENWGICSHPKPGGEVGATEAPPRWISRTPHGNKTAFCGVTWVSR